MPNWGFPTHIRNAVPVWDRAFDLEEMGDSKDGSPEAAHSAPEEPAETSPAAAGFLQRIFGKSEDADSGAARPVTHSPTGTQAILLNLRNMQNMRVEDVAIPNADITSVADDVTLEELVAVFSESGYTRLPVYCETLDDPRGFVHLKDLALHHGFGREEAFDLHELIRPLIYVPPSMPIGTLLQKMQKERMHMALVIDEYGGVDGLVTIEDLVEQIIGDIVDEHDEEEEALWTREASGTYLAYARAPLEEFEAEAGVDLLPDDEDEDVDTLGGLAFMLAGRVPARGEVIRDASGNEFEVIDADPRRIKRLRVRLAKSGLKAAE